MIIVKKCPKCQNEYTYNQFCHLDVPNGGPLSDMCLRAGAHADYSEGGIVHRTCTCGTHLGVTLTPGGNLDFDSDACEGLSILEYNEKRRTEK